MRFDLCARRARHAAVLLTLAGVLACSEPSAAPAPPAAEPQPVRTAAVRREAVAAPVRATGVITGKEEARLSFKIPGLVERVLVDEGDVVASGALLATLAPEEASSRVVQARMAYEKAQRDLARAEQLFAEGVAPLAQVQDARTQVDVTQAAVTMARFDAQHAAIRAPADGVILARLAEPNEMVAAGAPIVAFKAAGEGWIVRVGVADRDVVRLTLGDTAKVETNAHPGRPLAGTVTQIAAAASPATGTFDVELGLTPGELPLFSGLHARVEIEPGVRETLVLVPIEALVEGDGDAASVFTLDAERTHAVRSAVRIAFLSGTWAALRSGGDALSEVVTEGAGWLQHGAPVRVLAPPDVADAP
jgi:RND family efflux transporter MFP subunit